MGIEVFIIEFIPPSIFTNFSYPLEDKILAAETPLAPF